MAVRKEVGAGFQVLPVEAVNGDSGILRHLSLEGAHSARPDKIDPKLATKAEVHTDPRRHFREPALRLPIGGQRTATSNQRNRAGEGGAKGNPGLTPPPSALCLNYCISCATRTSYALRVGIGGLSRRVIILPESNKRKQKSKFVALVQSCLHLWRNQDRKQKTAGNGGQGASLL